MPVDNDIQASKGFDDLLHCPLHLCIAASEIGHDSQAMLHLAHLKSRTISSFTERICERMTTSMLMAKGA